MLRMQQQEVWMQMQKKIVVVAAVAIMAMVKKITCYHLCHSTVKVYHIKVHQDYSTSMVQDFIIEVHYHYTVEIYYLTMVYS
jgi:virulence-associated protein VapD